jgi:high-affinity Fe2+/Pb2+ permease
VLTIQRTVADGLPFAAVAVVGVACCAGLPAIAALVSGLALGAVLGVAGGILVAALVGVGVLAIRVRRRRGASPSTGARL